MLQQIRIKNFKCFREQSFRLAPLTILSGVNGAGKSSLIQALMLLKNSIGGEGVEKIVNVDDVFPQKIGAVSQLVSQDFIDSQQICLSAIAGAKTIEFRYVLEGRNKQNLKAILESVEADSTCFPMVQYLNAERVGPRLNQWFGESERQICSDGSNAAYLLETADQDGCLIASALRQDDEPKKFSYQVEKYLSAIMGELALYYEPDYDNAFIKTTIRTAAVDKPVSQPLTGFGFSYAFPIVVAGLLCTTSQNMALVVENPEAHLHPSAQSNMGKFLALVASCGVQVIVETHSEHIIDGARIQMADEKKTDQMVVHFFSYTKQGPLARELKVNEKGELSAWPKGFFDQKQTDLRTLLGMKQK